MNKNKLFYILFTTSSIGLLPSAEQEPKEPTKKNPTSQNASQELNQHKTFKPSNTSKTNNNTSPLTSTHEQSTTIAVPDYSYQQSTQNETLQNYTKRDQCKNYNATALLTQGAEFMFGKTETKQAEHKETNKRFVLSNINKGTVPAALQDRSSKFVDSFQEFLDQEMQEFQTNTKQEQTAFTEQQTKSRTFNERSLGQLHQLADVAIAYPSKLPPDFFSEHAKTISNLIKIHNQQTKQLIAERDAQKVFMKSLLEKFARSTNNSESNNNSSSNNHLPTNNRSNP